MKSEVIYQLIAFAHEEGGSLGLIGLHDDYRAGSIAVIGDVEVGDVDISLADSLQDAVEAARGISHLDADDLVEATLIAFSLQCFDGKGSVVYDETDDAEFSAVAGQHGINVNISLGEDGGDFGEATLIVFGEKRNLIEHGKSSLRFAIQQSHFTTDFDFCLSFFVFDFGGDEILRSVVINNYLGLDIAVCECYTRQSSRWSQGRILSMGLY